MGRVTDCLPLDSVRSSTRFFWLSTRPIAPPLKERVAALKTIAGSDSVDQWKHEVDDCGRRIEFGHVTGADPAELRRLCRETAKRTIAIVKKFDFSEEVIRHESGMAPSEAKKQAERYGGRWWRVGRHAGVEYRKCRQPHPMAFSMAETLAALGGDDKLAQEMALAYRIPAESPPTPGNHRLNNLVQHALRGDEEWLQAGTKRLESLAKKAQRVNWKAPPPALFQYPLAVIRRDEQLLVEALDKTTKQYKGIWDPKKFAAKEAEVRKHVEKHAKKLGPNRDWFNYFIDPWKRHFLSEWLLAWWPLTWLNIAHFRGMTGIFNDPEHFSEWTPLSLCAPLKTGASHPAKKRK